MREFYSNPLDIKPSRHSDDFLELLERQNAYLAWFELCQDIKPRQRTKEEIIREKQQELLKVWANEKNTVHKKFRHKYDLKKLLKEIEELK